MPFTAVAFRRSSGDKEKTTGTAGNRRYSHEGMLFEFFTSGRDASSADRLEGAVRRSRPRAPRTAFCDDLLYCTSQLDRTVVELSIGLELFSGAAE